MGKKFEYMSSNEWLGDSTTHFMKSGEALRSPENRDQESLSRYIPRTANGVKVEYDISFDIPGKIHGYKFSDFLTKALYVAPQSFVISRNNMKNVCDLGPTADGMRVIEALEHSITDKYLLGGDEDFVCDELVILPGTNLLTKPDIVDMEKIDELYRAGAYIKLHPITERTWCNFLKERWPNRTIDSDVPLYPLMRNAKKIWFTTSSETGIAATILKKKIGNINSSNKKMVTNFDHIYGGCDASKNGSILNKLTALFSHPESGILTTYHDNPEERVKQFFEHMSKIPHK